MAERTERDRKLWERNAEKVEKMWERVSGWPDKPTWSAGLCCPKIFGEILYRTTTRSMHSVVRAGSSRFVSNTESRGESMFLNRVRSATFLASTLLLLSLAGSSAAWAQCETQGFGSYLLD